MIYAPRRFINMYFTKRLRSLAIIKMHFIAFHYKPSPPLDFSEANEFKIMLQLIFWVLLGSATVRSTCPNCCLTFHLLLGLFLSQLPAASFQWQSEKHAASLILVPYVKLVTNLILPPPSFQYMHFLSSALGFSPKTQHMLWLHSRNMVLGWFSTIPKSMFWNTNPMGYLS